MSRIRTFGKVAAYCFFPVGTAAMLIRRNRLRTKGDFHQAHPNVYFALTLIWWLLVLATAGLFAIVWYAVEWLITPKVASDWDDDEIDLDGVRFELSTPLQSVSRRSLERDHLSFLMEVCALRRPTEIRTEVSESRILQDATLCVRQMRKARDLGVDLDILARRLELYIDDPDYLTSEETRVLLLEAESRLSKARPCSEISLIKRSVQELNASIYLTEMNGIAPGSLEMQILPGFMLVKSGPSPDCLGQRMIRAYEKFLFEWQLEALAEEGCLFDYDDDGVPAAFTARDAVCHRFYEAADPDSDLGKSFATHLAEFEPFG